MIGFLSALNTAAFTIEDFLDTIRELLRPVGISLFEVVEIIRRADTVSQKCQCGRYGL